MTTTKYHANDLERRIEAMSGVPIPEDDRIEDRLAFDWALMPTKRWAQITASSDATAPGVCSAQQSGGLPRLAWGARSCRDASRTAHRIWF